MTIKRLIIIFSTVIVLIITLCVVGYILGLGKDVVNIVAAPNDTKLILDDVTELSPGSHKLKTGTHTIKASRQDFNDQVKEFTTVNGQKNVVCFIMEPSNQAGIDYRGAHEAEFQKVYNIANGQVVGDINNEVGNYPIIKSLPASVKGLYAINYKQSLKHPYDSSRLAIYITADYPVGRQSAIEYIYSLGFDPSDYEIVFETSAASAADEGTGIGDSIEEGSEDELYNDLYNNGTTGQDVTQ